jgi:Mn2+/Fe2+ NRAMP family transporter
MKNIKFLLRSWKVRLLVFLSSFGPATITAMADNDASGVATYAIAGAKLGYPILFALFWITILLAVTQEMGTRLSLVTQKGLGDLIRERKGIRVSIFIFVALVIANLGTITVNTAAIKETAEMFNLPSIPLILVTLALTFIIVVKGNYKVTQNIMLFACLFYLAYIFSAFKSNPDWALATSNLIWPHGVTFSPEYLKNFIVIGLGVLGTTITPWGQFFISSFELDKHIDQAKLKYSQIETYWGAFLTDFFSFFMIVATAATLYANKIPLLNGNQAAIAIQPFAGKLAGTLFALGILNAGFMGIVIVGLSTTYAFTEFFGFSGSLDTSFKQSKYFYIVFLMQLIVAFVMVLFPFINLFKVAVASQILNAMTLPPIFYFLISFTNDKELMGEAANSKFQKWFAIVGTIIISLASVFAVANAIFNF